MTGFDRDTEGRALLGGIPLERILRDAKVPTPVYVYDVDGMVVGARELVDAFEGRDHLIAYAVKANSAGTIVRSLAETGCGADVVSRGELALALAAGVSPSHIVMSGVAKRDDEIDFALSKKILALQVESPEEVTRVAARARALGTTARLSLRLNPSVSIDSHHHIATGHDDAKFGMPIASISAVLRAIDDEKHLQLAGLSTHVGSMLTTVEPYLASARVVCDVARSRLASGHGLEYVDFGGGFGVDYGKKPAPRPSEFVRAACHLLESAGLSNLRLVIEPGRCLVAPYGVVISRVIQSKATPKHGWVLIDAAMNDLLRPALYGAHHRIEPLDRAPSEPLWRVAGPVCESSDDFGIHPLGPEPPTYVVIRDVGAYGFAMASEYNGRPLPSEVFVGRSGLQHVNPSPGVDTWVAARLRA